MNNNWAKPKRRKAKNAKKHISPFALRAKILKQMGFKSYREYLQSDLWKEIQTCVLKRDNHTCRYCRKPANQAHHRNYRSKTLRGTLIVDIVSICGECHKFISVENGKTCSMEKMKRKTLQLVKMINGQ